MERKDAVEEVILLNKKLNDKRYSSTHRCLMFERRNELIVKFHITYGDVWNIIYGDVFEFQGG